MSTDELAAWTAAAKAEGVAVGTWLWQLANRAAKAR